MPDIEDVFREYRDVSDNGPRTLLEIQTAIEAAGLVYEGVSGATLWGRLRGDWLDGTQAGHPFEDADDALNARYCDLAVSRGLLVEE